MRRSIASAACLLMCAAAQTGVAAQSPGPGLKETLDWMDSTYNSHIGTGGSLGHAIRALIDNGTPFKTTVERMASNGCDFTLTFHESPNMPGTQDMVVDWTDRFNLRDIDPGSLKVLKYSSWNVGLACDLVQTGQCDTAVIEFETRNQLPLMQTFTHVTFLKIKGPDHESQGSARTFASSFYIDDLVYAPRFVAAFRHAVELCGGRRSTF